MTEQAPATEPKSLNIVLEHTRAMLSAQNAQISALDGKANFGLASAALLTTAVVGLRTALRTPLKPAAEAQPPMIPPQYLSAGADLLTLLALAAFLAVVFCSYKAYQLRPFSAAPLPNEFRRDAVDQEETLTKQQLVGTLGDVYAHNADLLKDKVRWTRRAIRSIAAEAALLFLIAAVQALM